MKLAARANARSDSLDVLTSTGFTGRHSLTESPFSNHRLARHCGNKLVRSRNDRSPSRASTRVLTITDDIFSVNSVIIVGYFVVFRSII